MSNGRLKKAVIILMLVLLPGGAGHAFDGDAAVKTFKKCASCHTIGPHARKRAGPPLNGLADRQLGADPDYRYSPAMKKAGADGVVWNFDTLDLFLARPKTFIKGTRMVFGGIQKKSERHNLVYWLLHFDPDGNGLSDKADLARANGALLGADAARLEGDREYGEYLSGECVTCHKTSGAGDGIPPIVGWPNENFIHALYLYKTHVRENPVMRTVAKRLTDEEMAALAAYFGSLKSE